MKVIILAGGLGTRLSEYTKTIPKPMVKVAGYPLIIHIMSHYVKFGFNEFLIAAGYKGYVIKRYFKNYKKNGRTFKHKISKKSCFVTIVDTGLKLLQEGDLRLEIILEIMRVLLYLRRRNFIDQYKKITFTS